MHIFIVFLLCFLTGTAMAEPNAQSSSSSTQQIVMANSHWLPWRKVDNEGHLRGIEIDILKRLSHKLNLNLITKSCGWKRCLKFMEVGESDVMTGVFKTPERERYMKFITPAYRLTQGTCFYVNKEQPVEINNYRDLHNLKIGVVKGVSYFSKFDTDINIRKHAYTTGTDLFRLMQGKRIDTVIMACEAGDVRLKNENLKTKFKRANYVYRVEHPVYIAISKKSALLSREPEISKALQIMLDKGEINEILSSYGIIDIKESSH